MRWLLLLSLVGCAGVESVDIPEPSAQVQYLGDGPYLLHVASSDALVIEAAKAWNDVCGPVVAVGATGITVELYESANWPHPGFLGMTSETAPDVGLIELVNDSNRERMLHSAAHELGHAMGAVHASEPLDIMGEVALLEKRMPDASDCVRLRFRQ